jgi:hypothetical protein
VNGTLTNLAGVANGSRVSTGKQWLRFRVEGQQLMFRTWADGQPEPSTWAWSGTDASVTAPGRIHVSLVRATNSTGVKAVTLDDLVLTRP